MLKCIIGGAPLKISPINKFQAWKCDLFENSSLPRHGAQASGMRMHAQVPVHETVMATHHLHAPYSNQEWSKNDQIKMVKKASIYFTQNDNHYWYINLTSRH